MTKPTGPSLHWPKGSKPTVGTTLQHEGETFKMTADHGHLIEIEHLDGEFKGHVYRIGPDIFYRYEVIE